MKKIISSFLSVIILFAITVAALPVYAATTPTISITAPRTVLIPGQSVMLTVTTNPTGLSCTLTSSDSSVVEVDQNTKCILAKKKGQVTITAAYTDPATGTVTRGTLTVKVRTPTGIVDGTKYYIMNVNTGKYLALTSASDSNGIGLYGAPQTTSTTAQWRAENMRSDGTGLTQLYSVYSTAGRAIYTNGSSVYLSNSTSSTRTQFALHRIESGTNQGQYVIRYDNKYVGMNSAGNAFVTSSSADNIYWTFMAVEKGNADYFGHAYVSTDTNGNNTYVNTMRHLPTFRTLLSNYVVTSFENSTAPIGENALKIGDIFLFFGHGDPGAIYFQQSDGTITGSIAVTSMAALGNDKISLTYYNTNQLALQRCVLYIGCRTGVDYLTGYNLVDKTFEKGAHFVLGLTETVEMDDSVEWLEFFTQRIAAGYSINDASLYATQFTGIVSVMNQTTGNYYYISSFPIYTAGDGNQYLN